jgi:chromosomal replication initiation ATPase DnaA
MEAVLDGAGVLRIGTEAIIREMIVSLRYAALNAFRQKYLEVENLLVDNLWVLERWPAAADEICRLLRERQAAGRLTVVASDIPEQEWRARDSKVAQFLTGGKSVILG